MRLLCCVVLASVAVSAQDPSGLRFDAASIRKNTSGSGVSGGQVNNGQLQATNISFSWLLRTAYGVQESQIVGGTDWTQTERWDVMARAEHPQPKQFETRLRNLLADRFRLVAHQETREMPVYALMQVRASQLGPKLTRTTVDCSKPDQFCGTERGGTSLRSVGESMARLASLLSPPAGRIVIDKTGLAGVYGFELAWTSDAQRPPRPNDDGASIFTALQEQLGLKLDAQRGPVDVVVIDRVERPTED